MQENGPGRKRDRKAESKADTNERKRRLLALNRPESGGAIYTEETPLHFPTGKKSVELKIEVQSHNFFAVK